MQGYTDEDFERAFQLTPSRRATIIGLASSVIAVVFQLTPSRRATATEELKHWQKRISTHALTEGDQPWQESHSRNLHFNSRPHGGRPPYLRRTVITTPFQLTPSRRATKLVNQIPDDALISTHALTEGDSCLMIVYTRMSISTHALTEGDHPPCLSMRPGAIFQLTPSRRATSMAAL